MTPEEQAKRIKEINSLRYNWHERLLRDPVIRRFPCALTLAGYIMHLFHAQKGYAEFSTRQISRVLDMPRTSVIRARDLLIERSWLSVISKPETRTLKWQGTRYTLSGGPDDLCVDDVPGPAADTAGEAP